MSSFRNLPIFGRWTRGLRFRLTLSYVLFFTVLLTFLGIFFRGTLHSIYYDQTVDLLNEEWGAAKGYLRIDKGKIDWYYDSEDPEEAFIVDRLKQVYLLADSNGHVMQISPKYEELGTVESPEEIRKVLKPQPVRKAVAAAIPVWTTRRSPQGVPYLIRAGIFIDDNHKPFYLAIGRSLGDGDKIVNRFTKNYFLVLPLMILSCSLLGWFVSGRALAPVNEVSRTAQRITGSNLTAQIPSRGASDELDQLIDSFNRMIQRLNDSFTQTRQFSTDVSHELRTPLTAIRGQLEVAMFAAKTVEEYRNAIVDALQDVERLGQTIRALLLLSQAESGQLSLQKQILDFSALTEDIVDQFQIPAEDAKVTLTASLEPECMTAGDKIQLDRLVSNLLSNAVKYTPEGGSVHVTVRKHEDQVQLIMEDTGKGIPADHLPHIFDRFYRVPDRNPEKGLGLGLSFVAWIVKAHEGTVDVESIVGKGTRFTVSLPAAAVIPVPAEQTAENSTETAEKS